MLQKLKAFIVKIAHDEDFYWRELSCRDNAEKTAKLDIDKHIASYGVTHAYILSG
ncbi:MAG: hypothetical protein P4N59_18970 [Negativicutes bacterium]|nr:hypothetical protein [Negativicutes bacterium]